jgi:hypothetical protein
MRVRSASRAEQQEFLEVIGDVEQGLKTIETSLQQTNAICDVLLKEIFG